MHKAFLQEHRPGQYNVLLLSGKLWTYLADLNEQAADRLACIILQMRVAEGVTEELKARDPLLRDAIRLNLLTDRVDIVRDLGWRRNTSALTDTDVKYLLLYFEQNYGLTSEKKLTAALEQEQESNQKRLHDLAVMQSRLISKILIGEVKKVDGQKVQEVRIVYNFVGEIPEIAT